MNAESPQKKETGSGADAPVQVLASDSLVYMLLVALLWGTWSISQLGLFQSGDNTGYWIGVAGALMMLVLLLYPLRKYVKFAQNWGNIKIWFWFHIVLGVLGPLLVLLHSNFRTGSLNAAVALYSMVVVAGSGVAGRFLFQRVNRGLQGELTDLKTVAETAGLNKADARSRLAFAPKVEQTLKEFEEREKQTSDGFLFNMRAILWLPILRYGVYRQCAKELDSLLPKMAASQNWTSEDLKRRRVRSKKMVDRFLDGVVSVSQFSAYSFLFSLWHVAHIPFVYVLVITALVHVYAVHAY